MHDLLIGKEIISIFYLFLSQAIISNKRASSKLILTQNKFSDNKASLGPVIASGSNSYVFDGGQNCATDNIKDGYPNGCNGSYSFDEWTCTPFVVSEFCGNNRSIITEENGTESVLNAENSTETVFTIVNSTGTEQMKGIEIKRHHGKCITIISKLTLNVQIEEAFARTSHSKKAREC